MHRCAADASLASSPLQSRLPRKPEGDVVVPLASVNVTTCTAKFGEPRDAPPTMLVMATDLLVGAAQVWCAACI
jgi:hypothetical protein